MLGANIERMQEQMRSTILAGANCNVIARRELRRLVEMTLPEAYDALV